MRNLMTRSLGMATALFGVAAVLTQTNTKTFAATETYSLLEYIHPVYPGNEWVYDAHGIESSSMIERVDALSVPITLFKQGNPVQSFTRNVVRFLYAYGDYVGADFVPSDSWYEYQLAGNQWGMFGNDDDPGTMEMRIYPGAIVTNRLAIGQVLTFDNDMFINGTYQGKMTVKIQIVEQTGVTVPAGTYSDCIRLKFNFDAGKESQVSEMWCARGVGAVKKIRNVTKPSESFSEEYELRTASYVSPPLITAQPQDVTSSLGATASFSVNALGTAPLTYRWRKDGAALLDGGNLTGAATANLTIANFQASDSGKYSVLISNAYGCVTSAVASRVVSPAAGTYAGLFYDSNGVALASAGFVTAKVTSGGKFTAKLQQGANTYPLSGQFSATGDWGTGSIKNAPGWGIALQLGSDEITGVVSNGAWMAELAANRNVFTKVDSAPQAGQYTLVFPGSNDPAHLPGGHGGAAVSVSPAGVVSVSGTLGDGAKLTGKTFVSKQGQWPLYAALYGKKGVVLGWLTFTNDAAAKSDLEGVIGWIKPGQTGTQPYADGFDWPYDSRTNNAFGSVFHNRTPLLDWTDGTVILEGGNLAQNLTNSFSIDANNKVTGTNNLKLKITTSGAKAGLFSGSVVDPATGKPVRVNGAVLQNRSVGYGCFLGSDQSGSVALSPR
jgi:hypothetical protein